MTSADMNWFAVLVHHATRTPDKAITVFNGETITYGEMAERATALAGGLHDRGVGRGEVVGLLSYNCPEFLETVFAANYLGAIAMPINWRLAAPEVRYILEHSEAHALVCDESLVALANEATKGMEATLVQACVSHAAPEGWTAFADLRSMASRAGAGRGVGRRHPPSDVHIGHDGPAQGCHDHPRQPGLEEPRAHHRVRLHECGSRTRLRAALSRWRARPHHHVADRRRCDDDHPSCVRSLRRRR